MPAQNAASVSDEPWGIGEGVNQWWAMDSDDDGFWIVVVVGYECWVVDGGGVGGR